MKNISTEGIVGNENSVYKMGEPGSEGFSGRIWEKRV